LGHTKAHSKNAEYTLYSIRFVPFARVCGKLEAMSKVALVVVGLCLFLSASPQTTAPAGTIKIGTFLSLTGSTAAYGVSALNAIKLATDEVNRSGGVNGKQIELVVEDDHSNTQEVAGIVNKLIKEDKVDALIADQRCVGADERLRRRNRKDHPRCKSQRASACVHAAD
jgi:hypothetical protein